MNLPNKLTILRVIMIPLFMAFYMIDMPVAFSVLGLDITWNMILADLIFILASITDWADGYIARKEGIVTNFGKFMDPLADKLLVTAAFLCIMAAEGVSMWVVMITLSREFIVTGVRLIAASDGKVIAAGKMGKLKTVWQMITIIIAIITGRNLVVDILFWISAALAAISGIGYIKDNLHVFKNEQYYLNHKKGR